MGGRKWFILLVIFVVLWTACSEELDSAVPVPTASATAELVEEVEVATAEVTLMVTATATAVLPTATTENTPTIEPTTAPLRVAIDPAVPQQLRGIIDRAVTEIPQLAVGQPGATDVVLQVDADQPLALWVYAAVVPFQTVFDEISLADVRGSWKAGGLVMDAETAGVFSEVWGPPGGSFEPVVTENVVSELWGRQEGYDSAVIGIVPFEQLVPELKVLAVEGISPLDIEFDPAAYDLTVPIGFEGTAEDLAPLGALGLGSPILLTNREDSKITQIGMTGPAGMRRAVADRMEKYGLTYPAEETGPVLQALDIAHMSNENAFASDCPFPDPFDSVNVCNRDEYIELMTWMGIDINEMTGNHLNDWGADSLLHTFDLYDSVGIQTFGGGRDLAAAREPLLIEHNGNRLAFVGCNPVGPPSGWAGEDYPGSMPCPNYDFILNQVSELDEAGYLVFATLQYVEHYQYEVFGAQRRDFHNLAAAGATAVSGSHGHHPQGFSFFADSFIHYGLGNLLADQMFSLGTRQTFIDIYTVYDGRLISVELWTGLIEDFARQRLMTAEERQDLLRTVFEVSDWACCGE